MLSQIYFTIYEIYEVSDLGNHDNYGQKPARITEKFHNQFQLSINNYHDNNNFIVLNEIKCQDSRIDILDGHKYGFVDILMYPAWTGSPRLQNRMISRDGINFYKQSTQKLFGTYYFLYQE